MKYNFSLDKEQVKTLIEMIEQNRCEGESQICSDLRTSIKSQFQAQFKSHEEQVNLEVDDLLSAAKKTLGPGYCDNCD